MLFNSFDFAFFLPIVFLLYWFVTNRSLKAQNALLLVASYFFYGWWDWRFLGLLLLSTVVDFFLARNMVSTNSQSVKKRLLWVSLGLNLGLLGFFKYYNFFLENFISAFTFFGHPFEASTLEIVLPVGISFYTFQTLSYSIDVYRGNLTPTDKFIDFAAFVSFFPQLVAGPIERATNLLPQFGKHRTFSKETSIDGMRQILWGLFKKMVIADNCGTYVDMIFGGYQDYPGSVLALGVIFFAFQIYGDFSGYSDIAIGVAKLFGFDLMRNFALPYFSRDVAEFWRRWHISLSTWFRDYLYIPLGGSKGGNSKAIRNTMIIFLVSGFWHGANWTFIAWGALNALLFLPLIISGSHRRHLDTVAKDRFLPTAKELGLMLTNFSLIGITWVFFRANSIQAAFGYLGGMFDMSFFQMPTLFPVTVLFLLTILIIIEWIGRNELHPLALLSRVRQKWIRWIIYYAFVMLIFTFAVKNQQFIYFQF